MSEVPLYVSSRIQNMCATEEVTLFARLRRQADWALMWATEREGKGGMEGGREKEGGRGAPALSGHIPSVSCRWSQRQDVGRPLLVYYFRYVLVTVQSSGQLILKR